MIPGDKAYQALAFRIFRYDVSTLGGANNRVGCSDSNN